MSYTPVINGIVTHMIDYLADATATGITVPLSVSEWMHADIIPSFPAVIVTVDEEDPDEVLTQNFDGKIRLAIHDQGVKSEDVARNIRTLVHEVRLAVARHNGRIRNCKLCLEKVQYARLFRDGRPEMPRAVAFMTYRVIYKENA